MQCIGIGVNACVAAQTKFAHHPPVANKGTGIDRAGVTAGSIRAKSITGVSTSAWVCVSGAGDDQREGEENDESVFGWHDEFLWKLELKGFVGRRAMTAVDLPLLSAQLLAVSSAEG